MMTKVFKMIGFRQTDTHIHTHIHACDIYPPSYIHTLMHAYIDTVHKVHTYGHNYMHTCSDLPCSFGACVFAKDVAGQLTVTGTCTSTNDVLYLNHKGMRM